MKIRLSVNPVAFRDHRTVEQLRHSDSIDEKRWRWLVNHNEKQRAILTFLSLLIAYASQNSGRRSLVTGGVLT